LFRFDFTETELSCLKRFKMLLLLENKDIDTVIAKCSYFIS